MKYQRVFIISLLSLILILGAVLIISCEPIAPLKVKNETDQTLSIYVVWQDEAYYVGDVKPGEEIRNENSSILHLGSFPIEAKDSMGNVVYSRTYTGLELRQELKWKVVITPQEITPP